MAEQICDRCKEAPAVTYNEDHHEAVCETCAAFYCTGDNCDCIWVAPLGGD